MRKDKLLIVEAFRGTSFAVHLSTFDPLPLPNVLEKFRNKYARHWLGVHLNAGRPFKDAFLREGRLTGWYSMWLADPLWKDTDGYDKALDSIEEIGDTFAGWYVRIIIESCASRWKRVIKGDVSRRVISPSRFMITGYRYRG